MQKRPVEKYQLQLSQADAERERVLANCCLASASQGGVDLLNPGHTGSASQSEKPFKSRGTEKDVRPGQETRSSVIVRPAHPQVGPFCHNRLCMCILGGNWAMFGGQTNPPGFLRVLASIYFHRELLLFVP